MGKKRPKKKEALPGGRPTDYRARYADQGYRLCLLGYTDKELADFFLVSEQTLNTWKRKHSKFLESLKRGKADIDGKIGEKLVERALGYSHDAVKILQHEGHSYEHKYTEHYPPDVTAAIFWLKNRRAAQFRDKPDVQVEVNNETRVDLSRPPQEWTEAECAAFLAQHGVQVETKPASAGGQG